MITSKETWSIAREKEMEFCFIEMDQGTKEHGEITNRMDLEHLFMQTKNLILASIRTGIFTAMPDLSSATATFSEDIFTEAECKVSESIKKKKSNNGNSHTSKTIL